MLTDQPDLDDSSLGLSSWVFLGCIKLTKLHKASQSSRQNFSNQLGRARFGSWLASAICWSPVELHQRSSLPLCDFFVGETHYNRVTHQSRRSGTDSKPYSYAIEMFITWLKVLIFSHTLYLLTGITLNIKPMSLDDLDTESLNKISKNHTATEQYS